MADTLYTDIANKQNDVLYLTAERQDDGSKVTGNVLLARAVFTIDSKAGDADTIRIVKLPDGCTVLPHLCKVITDFTASPSPDLDITVGDDDDTVAADADRYCTTLTIDQSGGSVFDFAPGVAGATPYTLQKPSWITATLSGSANLAVGDTITFLIAYVAQA